MEPEEQNKDSKNLVRVETQGELDHLTPALAALREGLQGEPAAKDQAGPGKEDNRHGLCGAWGQKI